MEIFEYPYIIITIFVMVFIVLGIIGLYFTLKSVKTAKGTYEKSFCTINKIQNDFEKGGNAPKNRCIVYVSISLDKMKLHHSESTAIRMYEQIKRILLVHFGINFGEEICLYGKENFVALNNFESAETIRHIEESFKEINDAFLKYGVVNVAHIHCGYHHTSSSDVLFKTALARAKQACSIAESNSELYCEWDSNASKNFERKIKIENTIQNEIENNSFFLEYQPIIDAKTNTIIGGEVLARLNSPTEGILAPHVFLSAVNNVGLNQKFDYYIFEKNCKWISSNKENRAKHLYTINFSRHTLCDSDLAKNIINIIEKYNIDYSCIAVEILEDKSLNETEKATITDNLLQLKRKGVLILLDDFGKGYTNFNDLKDFDIDIVKIDKSITQSANNQAGFLILKSIITTAHELGFKTLCEGIETEEQKNLVIEAECDMLQGFYFNRPMLVTQFEKLFEK